MSIGFYKDTFPIKGGDYEAKYYLKKEGGYVKCVLCPQGCDIPDGEAGKCLVRINKGGKLYAGSYGKYASICLDPIEKKPLFHFYPTYNILSIGGVGCNFSCKFCQNWELVEGVVPVRSITPEELVSLIVESKSSRNIGIAFTYNEPTIWFEFIIDTANLLKKSAPDMKVVLVTNGYISVQPFEELSDFVDAMNIDLKFAKEELYKEVSDAHLKPVLTSIRRSFEKFKKNGKPFIELTYLIIPGVNDKEEDFKQVVDFISEIDNRIPLHISRFFPHFLMRDKPPTPLDVLKKAYDIARAKLKFVYVGNVWGDKGENTYCPSCGNILISRYGFTSSFENLDKTSGRCKVCKYEFFGVIGNTEITENFNIKRYKNTDKKIL